MDTGSRRSIALTLAAALGLGLLVVLPVAALRNREERQRCHLAQREARVSELPEEGRLLLDAGPKGHFSTPGAGPPLAAFPGPEGPVVTCLLHGSSLPEDGGGLAAEGVPEDLEARGAPAWMVARARALRARVPWFRRVPEPLPSLGVLAASLPFLLVPAALLVGLWRAAPLPFGLLWVVVTLGYYGLEVWPGSAPRYPDPGGRTLACAEAARVVDEALESHQSRTGRPASAGDRGLEELRALGVLPADLRHPGYGPGSFYTLLPAEALESLQVPEETGETPHRVVCLLHGPPWEFRRFGPALERLAAVGLGKLELERARDLAQRPPLIPYQRPLPGSSSFRSRLVLGPVLGFLLALLAWFPGALRRRRRSRPT